MKEGSKYNNTEQ